MPYGLLDCSHSPDRSIMAPPQEFCAGPLLAVSIIRNSFPISKYEVIMYNSFTVYSPEMNSMELLRQSVLERS